MVICFLLVAAINSPYAQVKILTVNPPATNPSIERVHSAHIIAYDNSIPSKHRLILMMVGTGGYASGTRDMDSVFATMGYHVISLDYENNVINRERALRPRPVFLLSCILKTLLMFITR